MGIKPSQTLLYVLVQWDGKETRQNQLSRTGHAGFHNPVFTPFTMLHSLLDRGRGEFLHQAVCDLLEKIAKGFLGL